MKQTRFYPKATILLLAATAWFAAPARAVVSTRWSLNPANGDWNLSDNWSGMTVPNGPGDVAAFGLSSITSLFLSANTELDSIVFNRGASAYTITASPTRTLTVSGSGIVNNSGINQTWSQRLIVAAMPA